MSEPTSRAWRFHIDDMVEFAEKVVAYTSGLDQQAFVVSDLVYDATLRNLKLIGEAATHVPNDVRAAWPQVPWHGYLGVDDDTLWSVVTTDLPGLLVVLRTMKGPAE